ncbi:ATP-binding protein [Bacillus sp. FJAT-27264]|uniref:two-component system sensor histidine kinase NtrB n=1 Tax=Paenibacillus sp. (strain DSM 101736 / FJAT-27264) TaxID=1850362 RepID=UPI0009F62F28|nr:ATP-binding protein [Bacillus sp. FJAT-27264]
MISITGAVKDILLQISAASSFLFLFQWWLDQNHCKRRNSKLDNQSFLMIACALSVTLCSLMSTSLFGITYLNLGILPAFIGILYGSFRSGFCLSLLFLFCNILFSKTEGLSTLLLNSSVLLYPLLFGMSNRFKKGTVVEKIGLLWMVLLPSMLFVALVPILGGQDKYERHFGNSGDAMEALILTLYVFIAIVLGAVFIYFVEVTWGRVHLKERMKDFTEKFQWESEKLQQITDIMPLSIMSLDENGAITGINDYMLELIRSHYPNVTKVDIMSQPVCRLFREDVDEEIFTRMRASIRTKERSSEKVIHKAKVYHIFIAPLPPRMPGLSGGSLLIVQDLTEEEKMRSELDNVERLTLVGQMAAGITHEIRNPMAVVRGFLQLMREKSGPDLESYYHIVMEELDRANSIINDFLSLAQSRISHKENVLLHEIIDDLSPLLWADANLRGQSVEVKLSSSLPSLDLNVREIKQLILNLGRNGMEAMGPKGVLTLETRTLQDHVELIIRDTGSGISESQREKLFVPFFTTKSQGTGLGLSLCLSIVERHNGTIAVDSEEGKGTVFTISFPAVCAEMSEYVIAETKEASAR